MEERPWTKSEFFAWSDGRRIVDLYELSKQLHCKQCRSLLDLGRTEREARYGLASVLYILCNCGVMNDVHTGRTQQDGGASNSPSPMYEINIKASINLLMYGAGASRILSFLALLDIPVPPPDDTSLIVPVTEDADMQNTPSSLALPPPSTTSIPTSNATATSATPAAKAATSDDSAPFQKPPPPSTAPSSFTPEPGFRPVPLPPRDDEDEDNAVALQDVEDEDDDNDIDDDDDDDDDDDEEYVPTSKPKPKPKPAPAPKKKSLLRGPKSARAKQAAKQAAKKRPPVKLKVKIKKESEETPKKAEVIEKQPEQPSVRQYVDPTDWSSSETETESVGGKHKESDDSWHEGEEDVREDEEVDSRPKRKRGRPRGSPDKSKRVRRSGSNKTKAETSSPKKTRVKAEGKEVPRCETCNKDFTGAKGYNLHMKRVHNQEMKEHVDLDNLLVFVCGLCHLPYAREHRAVSHLKMKHWSPTEKTNEMYYKIPLTDFIKYGNEQGKYSCQYCEMSDMSRQKAGDHMCVSVNGFASCVTQCPEGKKLTKQDVSNLFQVNEKCSLCDHCGAQFSEVVGLESHLHNVHHIVTQRLQEHKCTTCGALFPTRSRLNRHANAKHRDGPDAKTYMCDFCGKAYPSKSTMFRHRQYKHISGERFQCEYCPKKFFKRHLWIIHTKRHLGEAPHQCQVCGKDFSCKYNLKTHERIHTGERPYQCKLCEAAFAQKTSLDVHMKKHQILP